MHSVLISLDHILPGFAIYTFGACLAVAFLLCFYFLDRLCKRTGRPPELASQIMIIALVTAVIGARGAYVIEHWADFKGNVAQIFNLRDGGIMFFGGMLFAWLALTIFCRIKKESPLEVLDMVVTMLPLGHAIGRLGCFFNGCCHGRVCDTPISITFPAGSPPWGEHVKSGLITPLAERSAPVLPSQLIESAANLLIFAVLYWRFPRLRRSGTQMVAYAFMYPVTRIIVETTRGDERYMRFGLTISQLISLGILLFGITFGLYIWKTQKPRIAVTEEIKN